jgi:hypothetical protein
MLVPEREEPEAKPAAECYPKKGWFVVLETVSGAKWVL